MNQVEVSDEVVKTIISLLGEVLEDEVPEDINAETMLIEELEIDSLQIVNLALLLEEAFDIEIDFESFTMDDLHRVKTLAEFVQSRKDM